MRFCTKSICKNWRHAEMLKNFVEYFNILTIISFELIADISNVGHASVVAAATAALKYFEKNPELIPILYR